MMPLLMIVHVLKSSKQVRLSGDNTMQVPSSKGNGEDTALLITTIPERTLIFVYRFELNQVKPI